MGDTSRGALSAADSERLLQVVADVSRRRLQGESVDDASVIAAHPELMPTLGERLRALQRVERGMRTSDDARASARRDARNRRPVPPIAITGYELTGEIHRGGQGVVYRAVQLSTNRDVAIKVLRDGALSSVRDRARFEREVQVLASVKHPDIVSIYDSGEADGQCYLVMDLVQGRRLDEYLRGRDVSLSGSSTRWERVRSTRAKLELFVRICEAINAAHVRGVIHRDLKPSNILITDDGAPRVLDFGLAKITETTDSSDLREQTLTEPGQFVGTLSYASPEQADGGEDAIDMRTDVYSLGVMLYTSLTGRFPYDVTGRPHEIVRRILHDAPTSPSRAATHIEADVDAILLKCLSKEPARRYETAGELARDLRRFLEGKPVEAKRDSGWYLFRVFVRRHRVAVLIAAAFIATLGVSSVAMTYLYRAQSRQRELAEARAKDLADTTEQLEAATDFQREQIASLDPILMGARLKADLLARAPNGPEAAAVKTALDEVDFRALAMEMLDRNIYEGAWQAIDQQFADRPHVRARLLETLAETMSRLGLYERAIGPMDEVVEICQAEFGSEHQKTLVALNNAVTLRIQSGDVDGAEALNREVLAIAARSVVDADVAHYARYQRAILLENRGQLPEAVAKYQSVLADMRRDCGVDDPKALQVANALADALTMLGRNEEAEALFRELLEVYRSQPEGMAQESALAAMKNFGQLLVNAGRFDEAEPLLREACAAAERVYGAGHPRVHMVELTLGQLLAAQNRLPEAEIVAKQAAGGLRDALGTRHTQSLSAESLLGHIQRRRGKDENAEAHLRSLYERSLETLGPEHPDTLSDLNNLARYLGREGATGEAERMLREVLTARRRLFGNDHFKTLISMHNLGDLLRNLGELDEARELGAEAVSGAERTLEPDHPFLLAARRVYARALRALGEFEQAERVLLDAVEGRTDDSSLAKDVAGAIDELADLYEAWDAREPDDGYAAKAARWRELIEAEPANDAAEAGD